MFVPFYILFFIVHNLEGTWRPVGLYFFGLFIILLCVVTAELHGDFTDGRGPEPVEQAPPAASPPKPDAPNAPSANAARPFDVDPKAKAAGKTVYLSVFTPFEYKAGPWGLGMGVMGEDGKSPLVFQRKLYKYGISMHPPMGGACRVSFAPGKEFKLFRGRVAITDCPDAPRGAVVFAVYGDGRKLWESAPVGKDAAAALEFNVDVSGADVLTLESRMHSGHYGYVHATWLDPWLER
jgi:hypothetical protein